MAPGPLPPAGVTRLIFPGAAPPGAERSQPPAEAKGDAAKMMHVGNVHFAIRGLADTDAWVSKIKELQRQLPQS